MEKTSYSEERVQQVPLRAQVSRAPPRNANKRNNLLSSISKTGTFLATCGLMLAQPARADNHGGDDLMETNGRFGKQNGISFTDSIAGKNWFVVSPDSYAFTQGDDYVEMTKKTTEEGAEGFYDDGLTYLFRDAAGELIEVRPRHIHFEVQTKTATEMESCDFRFYSVEQVPDVTFESRSDRRLDGHLGEEEETEAQHTEDKKTSQEVTAAPTGPSSIYKRVEFSDVALFRLGYFDYLKLNTENMLQRYEADKWFRIDLLLDWDEQRVTIYVDEQPLKSAPFFTQRKDKLTSGNAVSIYGLTPGSISKFRDIKMCMHVCPTQKSFEFTDLSGAVLGYGAGLAAASTLLLALLA